MVSPCSPSTLGSTTPSAIPTNFFEVSRDIDAAVQTAKALGYRSIVLQGHSLGTLQVLFYAATNWDRAIKAVVQLSTLGDLPWRSRYLQIQDEDKFRQLSDAALKSLRDGKEQEILPIRMRRTATEEEPVTGEYFLTYRTEATAGPMVRSGFAAFPDPFSWCETLEI